MVLVGKVKSVQFECIDFGKGYSESCSGKAQVKTNNNKLNTVQFRWRPKEETPQWLYSTKELTFYVEPLEHTTEYGLLRVTGAE